MENVEQGDRSYYWHKYVYVSLSTWLTMLTISLVIQFVRGPYPGLERNETYSDNQNHDGCILLSLSLGGVNNFPGTGKI